MGESSGNAGVILAITSALLFGALVGAILEHRFGSPYDIPQCQHAALTLPPESGVPSARLGTWNSISPGETIPCTADNGCVTATSFVSTVLDLKAGQTSTRKIYCGPMGDCWVIYAQRYPE